VGNKEKLKIKTEYFGLLNDYLHDCRGLRHKTAVLSVSLIQNLCLRRLCFRNIKNSNNPCLAFIATESGFHPIPLLVRETITATETGNGTDSGNGTTATA